MADLQHRAEHEIRFGVRLGRLNAELRRQIVEAIGGPKQLNDPPPELWERVRQENEDAMAALLFAIILASATQHGLPSAQAETLAQASAAQRAAEVAAGFTDHSRERLTAHMEDWRRRVAEGLPVFQGDIDEAAESIFGPKRLEGIAVNETTWGATAGSEGAIAATVGLSEDDIWWTEDDTHVCPICRPLHKKRRSVWSRLFPQGSPAHPGCRCWIQYARERVAGSRESG